MLNPSTLVRDVHHYQKGGYDPRTEWIVALIGKRGDHTVDQLRSGDLVYAIVVLKDRHTISS